MPSDLQQRRMRLVADDHRDRRRAEESVAPRRPSRHCASTAWRAARERGEVRHRRAGDEAPRQFRRQAEHVEQPAQRDLLQRGGRPATPATARRSGPRRRPASSPRARPGSEPPITKPKKRGPAVAIVAGEPISSSSARTARGSDWSVGNGSSSSASRARASSAGLTRRSSRLCQ